MMTDTDDPSRHWNTREDGKVCMGEHPKMGDCDWVDRETAEAIVRARGARRSAHQPALAEARASVSLDKGDAETRVCAPLFATPAEAVACLREYRSYIAHCDAHGGDVRKYDAALESLEAEVTSWDAWARERSAEIPYKGLQRNASLRSYLGAQIATTLRNLDWETQEHQRHHDEEAKLNARIRALESELAEKTARVAWREPSALGNGDFAVFRMPIVINGKPDVDIWVSRLRERESEDEDGNVDGCWQELEDCGYEWEVVKAEALCIPLDALPALPSEPVKP